MGAGGLVEVHGVEFSDFGGLGFGESYGLLNVLKVLQFRFVFEVFRSRL